MIRGRVVLALGISQLVCWGITYYLIGGFGERMAADLGWSRGVIYGGFSTALLVMGLASPFVGRMIDRQGGRYVMSAGSLLTAAACAGLALSHSLVAYYASWMLLGIAMRMTLYDAAFAVLARAGGAAARRPMSQITLLGGLASTVFWPLGQGLAAMFGWRTAVLLYAGIALLTLPLHMAMPHDSDAGHVPPVPPATAPPRLTGKAATRAAILYASSTMLAQFLNAGMSAHMIGILAGMGLAEAASVWVSTLRGVGQSSSRLSELLFGGSLSPRTLNVLAAIMLVAAFAAALLSAQFLVAALTFAFVYGAGNGLMTITRGTLPLAMFDHRTYGALVGRLLAPSFLVAATAPAVYAAVIDRWGEPAALGLSLAIALATLAAALAMQLPADPAD
ncbi:MAG: MFS transporter [Vicinamibacterales bacterium]